MARTIGEVDFIVGFDGRALPAEARAIGQKAGDAAATGFRGKFSEGVNALRNDVRPALQQLGKDFIDNTPAIQIFKDRLDSVGNSLRDRLEPIITNARGVLSGFGDDFKERFAPAVTFAKDQVESFRGGLSNVRDRFVEVRGRAEELGASLRTKLGSSIQVVRDTFLQASQPVRDFGERLRVLGPQMDKIRPSVDRVKDSFTRFFNIFRRGGGGGAGGGGVSAVEDFSKRILPELDHNVTKAGNSHGWSSLSTNAKQVILIIAAIVSGAQEIAVLGEAAGAGIFILAGAVAALAAGGVVLGVAFQGMLGDLDKVDPSARGAAAALQALKTPLGALQNSLQGTVFAGLADQISQIGTVLIPGLQGALTTLAGFVNSTLSDALNFALDPARISVWSQLLAGSGPIFQNLVDGALNLFDAISNIGLVALPFVQDFASGLKDLLGRFDAFTKSAKGQSAIHDFFQNGVEILGKFTDLLGGAVKLVGNLVTPETVKQTGQFLDDLTGSLPFIQELISSVGQLNVFGIIAKALNDVGNALNPILAALAPVFSVISSLADIILESLAPSLSLIGLLLTPFKIGFQIIADIFQRIEPYIDAVTGALNSVIVALQAGADSIFASLKPSLDQLFDSLQTLLPSPQELADIIQNQVIPAIKAGADWISNHLVPATQDIIDHLTDFIDSLGGFDGIEKKLKAASGFFEAFSTQVVRFLEGPIGALQNIIDLINLINGKSVTVSGGGGGKPNTRLAAGGILNRATQIAPGVTAGEAGIEAVVPLDRPLNQVNPQVRGLSAIAQGLGGTGSTGPTYILESGAVTAITPSADPAIVVSQLVDRLVEALP